MTNVNETKLPGVGVRFDFTTTRGEDVGVIVHRGGRRELIVYDTADPDRCTTILHLSVDDTHTLNEVLGGSRISELTNQVEKEIEGLSIDWITIPETSGFVGKSIGEGTIRSRTGVSIVAVLRSAETFPSPEPSFVFEAGDVAVAVGTPPGIDETRTILRT